MKRIYEQYSTKKELVGYDYNGYYIEVEYELRRGLYASFKKWYHITLKDGTRFCYDLLKEAKERIDQDLK